MDVSTNKGIGMLAVNEEKTRSICSFELGYNFSRTECWYLVLWIFNL